MISTQKGLLVRCTITLKVFFIRKLRKQKLSDGDSQIVPPVLMYIYVWHDLIYKVLMLLDGLAR